MVTWYKRRQLCITRIEVSNKRYPLRGIPPSLNKDKIINKIVKKYKALTGASCLFGGDCNEKMKKVVRHFVVEGILDLF